MREIKRISHLTKDCWFDWNTLAGVHGGVFKLRCGDASDYWAWKKVLVENGVPSG